MTFDQIINILNPELTLAIAVPFKYCDKNKDVCSITLHNGSKFGVLPNSDFIYGIIKVSNPETIKEIVIQLIEEGKTFAVQEVPLCALKDLESSHSFIKS